MINNSAKNSITAYTIISVIVLSFTPMLGVFVQDIYSTFWFPILTLAYMLVLYSIGCSNRRYLLIIVLSLIGSIGVAIVFIGVPYGYILLFFLLSLKHVCLSSLAAYILVTVINRISNRDSPQNSILTKFYTSIFIVSIFSLGFVVYQYQDKQDLLFGEINKKGELAKSVVQYVLKNEEVLKNDFNLYESGLHKGIYEESQGKVIHNFGGEVSVEFHGNEILMIYRDFPNKEDCFQFFYVNDLHYKGFKRTFVDETEFISAANVNSINRNKALTCSKGEDKVTIVFKGTLTDFKKSVLF